MIQKENTYTLFKISNKINEIIDKINTIPDPPKPTKGTEAGDICYVSGGKKYFCTADEWNDNLGTPIGVVVVPSSHNEDGSSTIISLANMSCVTPETGSLSRDAVEGDNYMCFGGYGYNIPGITNYDTIPVVDPYSGTSTGTRMSGYFASDMWADSTIAEDTGATPVLSKDGVSMYPTGYDDQFIASPYNADGSKNTEYNVANTVLSYTCGKELSAAINAVTTEPDLVPADAYEGCYPANKCCLLYKTVGTDPGDWYLPCVSELGYLSARFVKINNSLKMIDNAVEIGDYYSSDILGASMWSSNTYAEDSAWRYVPQDQFCDNYDKGRYVDDCRVRAFTQVFGTKVKPKPQPTPPTPTYEYVDLGLPSGLKWAKCNVGAEHEYDPGLYFAWGDTTGYAGDAGHDFSWDNYKWSINGSSSNFSKYNDKGATLDLEDDAAHANLGGSWRMPTADEIDELIYNTTQTWTDDYNGTGKAGYIVKSETNGNQIFMPAAGSCDDSSLYDFGSYGYYWSSSQTTDYSLNGFILNFNSGDFYRPNGGRCRGFSVRGVCE